jgi:hypothetical protein
LSSLIRLRTEGVISREKYFKYNLYIYLNAKLSVYLIFFIMMHVPVTLLRGLVKSSDRHRVKIASGSGYD